MAEFIGVVIWILILVIFMITISLLEQENFATFFAFWLSMVIFSLIIFLFFFTLFRRPVGYRIN